MNIAEKLRKLREEKKLSQNQLIEDLYKTQGVSVAISSIRNYENVKAPRTPQNVILLALARYYNVSLEYLLDDNIIAKEKNNIDISKELGLSDRSIENIKMLISESCNCTTPMNDFISNKSFINIICLYSEVQKFNKLYLLFKEKYIPIFCDNKTLFINNFNSDNIFDKLILTKDSTQITKEQAFKYLDDYEILARYIYSYDDTEIIRYKCNNRK